MAGLTIFTIYDSGEIVDSWAKVAVCGHFCQRRIVGTLFCVYRHASVLGTGVKEMVWLDVAS